MATPFVSGIAVLVTIVVYLANFSNAFEINKPYMINRLLEKAYVDKYGNGQPVKWDALAKLTIEQQSEVCRIAHERIGYGKLQSTDMKKTTIQDAYLTFSYPDVEKSQIQVLSCQKRNEDQFVYYLTKALDESSVMFVYPIRNRKNRSQIEEYNGKNVFYVTKRKPINEIPTLKSVQ